MAARPCSVFVVVLSLAWSSVFFFSFLYGVKAQHSRLIFMGTWFSGICGRECSFRAFEVQAAELPSVLFLDNVTEQRDSPSGLPAVSAPSPPGVSRQVVPGPLGSSQGGGLCWKGAWAVTSKGQ